MTMYLQSFIRSLILNHFLWFFLQYFWICTNILPFTSHWTSISLESRLMLPIFLGCKLYHNSFIQTAITLGFFHWGVSHLSRQFSLTQRLMMTANYTNLLASFINFYWNICHRNHGLPKHFRFSIHSSQLAGYFKLYPSLMMDHWFRNPVYQFIVSNTCNWITT